MAQHRGRQGEWPLADQSGVERNAPVGHFVNPDGYQVTPDQAVAGPLRMGTAPGVGPRGRAVEADITRSTDYGTDRVSPRGFDPEGTATKRYGPQPGSPLVAIEVRGRDR